MLEEMKEVLRKHPDYNCNQVAKETGRESRSSTVAKNYWMAKCELMEEFSGKTLTEWAGESKTPRISPFKASYSDETSSRVQLYSEKVKTPKNPSKMPNKWYDEMGVLYEQEHNKWFASAGGNRKECENIEEIWQKSLDWYEFEYKGVKYRLTKFNYEKKEEPYMWAPTTERDYLAAKSFHENGFFE